ncbi:GIY-YIG nuclease family protein [Nonomuraea sp. NPDC049758]|uniref:GIY-YIG nuclease family protein n=1 Tax=Nonomuraea sp. NPDC049758 TaxID=3154360 RepID=UPI0034266CCA
MLVRHDEPWTGESELIAQLDLPLNLDQNRRHAFHPYLSGLRSSACAHARGLPISA